MNIDSELDLWRRQWQSHTVVPTDLRRKVERQSRMVKIALIGDVLVTVVIGGGTIARAVRSPEPDIVVLAAVTWLFLAAAWTFTLTVRRGKWGPSGIDSTAFVEFLLRRCRDALKATAFGAILFITEMTFCLGWIYYHNPPPRRPLLAWLFSNSVAIESVWACTVMFFGFLVWYRRKKRAELAYLETLRTQMSASAPG